MCKFDATPERVTLTVASLFKEKPMRKYATATAMAMMKNINDQKFAASESACPVDSKTEINFANT